MKNLDELKTTILEHKIPFLAAARNLRISCAISPTNCKPSNESMDLSSSKGNFYGWLTSFGLQHRDLIPLYCHEPHIVHGYRPTPSSVGYCFKSIFLPTNETLNIWTHGIPCFLFIYHILSFASANFTDWWDPVLYPYWLFVIGIVLTLFGSTCAHIFNCLSVGAREVCFCCDYSTIAIHAIGLTAVVTYYICPYKCIAPELELSSLMYLIFMLGNIGCVISACFTRFPNVKNKDCLRVLPYVLMYILLMFPCIYQFFFAPFGSNLPLVPSVCRLPVSPIKQSLFLHSCGAFLIGAIVHAYKVPERFFPGFFDIVGHSHQIFHLVTSMGLYYQSRMVEKNLVQILYLLNERKISPADLHLDVLFSLIVPLVASLLACVAAVHYAATLYQMRSKSAKIKT